ncbi:MAG: hypothetical protein ACLQNE_20260 [Thermoguttaceae bacterium]
MFSRISIVCFASSYLVVLGLEITRLLFRSRIREAVRFGFLGAGLLAHTIFLFNQAFHVVAEWNGSLLADRQDWFLVAAWVLAAAYTYGTFHYPSAPFGLFLLPLVLGLIGVGTCFRNAGPFTQVPASELLATVHGMSVLLSAVAVLIGLAAGLMYLDQGRRLKHKSPPTRWLRMPSLEWLRQTNHRALIAAAAMLAVGIVTGFALNVIRHGEGARPLPWSDPAVLATVVMFLWLLLHIGIGRFYKPAREGRKVAYFTIVSFIFIFLVIAVAMAMLIDTQHGRARRDAQHSASSREPGDPQTTVGMARSTRTASRSALCHSERSEESARFSEILRYAQDDTAELPCCKIIGTGGSSPCSLPSPVPGDDA